jgi:hypothetical protein
MQALFTKISAFISSKFTKTVYNVSTNNKKYKATIELSLNKKSKFYSTNNNIFLKSGIPIIITNLYKSIFNLDTLDKKMSPMKKETYQLSNIDNIKNYKSFVG